MRQPGAGRRPEQEHPRAVARGDMTPSANARPADPAPGSELVGRRARQAASASVRNGSRRVAAGWSVQRATATRSSAPRPWRRRCSSLQHGPPTALERAHEPRHAGNSSHVRGDDDAAAVVQRAARECGQRVIGWDDGDAHVISSSRSRSRFIASRMRDFTVPSGMLQPFGDFGVRPALEERKRDDLHLLLASAVATAARTRVRARRPTAIGRAAPVSLGFISRIERRQRMRRAGRAAAVDAQIARDREDPGRRAGARRIEKLAPCATRSAGFLRQFLGGRRWRRPCAA